MDIRTLLGKTFNFTKFRVDTKETVLFEALSANLDMLAFQELEGAIEKNMGFVTVQEVYAEHPIFTTKKISYAQDRFAVFAYRYDIKSVDASAMKREIARRSEALLESCRNSGQEKKYLSKEDKAYIKTKVKDEMLTKMSAKTKVIPIVFDRDAKNLYVFTKSEKALMEIRENLISIFNEFEVEMEIDYSFDRFEDREVDYKELLTWFWWKSESNQFFEIGDRKIFLGDDIELTLDESKKITAKGASEQVRTAITSGATVSKILVSSESFCSVPLSFTLLSDGSVSGVKFASYNSFNEMHEEDDTFLLDLIQVLSDVTDYNKEVAIAYKNAFVNNEVVNQSVRNTWGRGDFCTKSFDDI